MSNQLTTWQESLSAGHQKFITVLNYDTGEVPIEVKKKAKQEIGFAFQMIQNNTMLQTCDPNSIINAIANIARTSITLNPVMRLAYLVPRNGKCVLDFSYMGMTSMLKENGNIRTINAYIVFEDEEFEHDIVENVIRHKPKYSQTETEHNSRKIIGAYSVAKLPTGDVDYCFMPMWEIDKVKNSSKGSNSNYSPWNTWRDEMIKKTVIKRHFKTLISVNDSYNSSLVNVLEIENENNGLKDEFTTTKPKNKITEAFSSPQVENDVNEKIVDKIIQNAETIDVEEVKKPETKVENVEKTKTTSTKEKKTSKAPVKEVKDEPTEVVDQSTGEVLEINDDSEDLITEEMEAEIQQEADGTLSMDFENDDF